MSQFSEITRPDELISYLKQPQRFNSIKYVTKYTTMSSVLNIFSEEKLLINHPKNMNDMFEYEAFPKSRWNKICFASFITQNTESIAMWCMYAQPWNEGVKISIPFNAFKELIKNTPHLLSADYNKDTGRYTPGSQEIPAKGILSFSRIAYKDGQTITCIGRSDRNHNFKNPYSMPELAGYIKDSAWSYEKEMRLRVDLPESYSGNAVYLKLPKEFLDQIKVTTGPQFKGPRPENYLSSQFTDKLKWIPCGDCPKYKSK